MFTGLVESVGSVSEVTTRGDGVRLSLHAPDVLADATHGDSIAVNGVCLTIAELDTASGNPAFKGSTVPAHASSTQEARLTRSEFSADVMRQTLNMSTLAQVEPGTRVNLERAAKVGDRLGGHIVQGHIDGTATVTEVRPGDQWRVLRFTMTPHIAPLIVDKGSVAVDGVSLTVSAVSAPHGDSQWFEVSLIPETLHATTLGSLTVGNTVNIETDILARHAQRFYAFATQEHFSTPAQRAGEYAAAADRPTTRDTRYPR